MKTIGIVGSRRRVSVNDEILLLTEFDKHYTKGDRIVSGGCERGADNMAEDLAKERGITIIIHYPRLEDLDAGLLSINPRAAYAKINYARNASIAADCDLLIALPAPDRTGGTEDTIKRASRLGKPVHLVRRK